MFNTTLETLNRPSRLALSTGLLWLCIATLLQAASLPPVTGNLLIALDGSDVSTSGSAVTSWNDQAALGGSQNFATGTSPTLVSQATPNGTTHNVVDFDGTNDFLQLGADANMDTNTLSWFMVMRTDDVSSTQLVLRSNYASGAAGGSSVLWGSFVSSTGSRIISHSRTSTGSFAGDGPAGSDGEWVLIEAVWNGTASALNGNGGETLYDRVFDSSGAEIFGMSFSGVDASPNGHVLTNLGQNSTGGSFFNGGIAEVLIYNTALNDADRVAVENYLLNKFIVVPPVPEPSSVVILSLGLVAIVARRKRRGTRTTVG